MTFAPANMMHNSIEKQTADNLTLLSMSINGSGVLIEHERTFRQMSPFMTADDCMQFDFYLYVIAIGSLCLLGFAANTICLLLISKHQSNLLRCVRVDRRTSEFNVLLQATVIADVFLLWTIFFGHVIPSLAYVTPLLRQCTITCEWLAAIHRPLSALSLVLVVWMTTASVVCAQSLVGNEVIAMSTSSSDMSFGMNANHSKRKVKLIIAALVLCAIVYVVPMAFDHSIVRTVHAASSRNVTNIVLADDTLFRLLYGKALALLVVVVPLVWIIGVTISLPTTWRALKRSTVDSGSTGSTRVRDLVQQLQRAGRCGLLCQMNDIINVAATLAAVLLLVYVPQVVVRIVDWLSESRRLPSCNGLVDAVNVEYSDILYYGQSAGQLLIVVNSTLKLPALCFASRQYRDCLRRLCCCCPAIRGTTSARVSFVPVFKPPRQLSVLENGRRDEQLPSTRVTLISSLSDDGNHIGLDDIKCTPDTSYDIDGHDSFNSDAVDALIDSESVDNVE